MGISGLLPLLKKASKNSHVRKFSGCTVAIDAYCWLHKGAFGCAEKLGKGEPTDAYITYCMKYIQVLLDNKVKPILVLDGRNLPSKEHTEKKRRQKRKENRELARKYLQEGNRKGAWECFTKCVDITPTMARAFIKVLREKKIDYVVAPYEADAQLAYLAKAGIADIIITEDSDLVLFGCPRILFKMSVNGDGVFFDVDKLPQCFGLTKSKFNFDHFRWMCILSGCDYLPSIPGIGLGRAKKVIMSLASTQNDIREMILSIPSVLEKIQVEITDEYIAGFIQAENTFLYQLVFDTRKRMLIPLNPYPEDLGPKDLPFAGSYEHQNLAVELALGNVDLHSLKTVDHYEPLKSGYTTSSIWSPSFEVGKQNFAMKELKASGSVGMQISVASSSSSKMTTSKKKRPLALVNSDTEDNGLDDMELMNMYSISKIEPRSAEVLSSDEDTEVKVVVKVEDDCSPSGIKRRRLSTRKTEESHDGSSCYTRSTRSKVVPFQKSPANSKVHVKSKYWRSDEETASRAVKLELTEVKKEESDDESEDEDFSELPQNLNIYSYESSQDSALSDISASQRSLPFDSQKSGESSEYFQTGVIKECSVIIKKTEIQEITLEDDEDDEAYNSSNSNIKVETETTSQSQSSTSFQLTRSFSTPSSSPAASTRSTTSRASSASASKSSLGRGLRVGLSKSTKKDPKQPSVRDMFTRHKSVQ